MLSLARSARGRANTRRRLSVLAPVTAGVESRALQHEVCRFPAAVVVAQVRDLELAINKLLPLLTRSDDATRNCCVPVDLHLWQAFPAPSTVDPIMVALVFQRLQVELQR
jgi:hypothetical protein